MQNNTYPYGTVEALLQTDLVSQNTLIILQDRLKKEKTIIPAFFNAEIFQTLRAVCRRLIPQNDHDAKVDLAGLLDQQLATGSGKGWRFNQMPPDKIAYRTGLYGIHETAEWMFDKAFSYLNEMEQDKVLLEVQSGTAKGNTWKQIPATLFFTELLASLTELYYSHPVAKDEIGEVAFADRKGWQKIGLNEHENHEPLPLKKLEMKHNNRQNNYAGFAPDMYGIKIPMQQFSAGEIADAVIIGTGAGGAPLLSRLAKAGLKVVALEAGKHWSSTKDFATDELSQAKLFWMDERLSAGSDPLYFGSNNSGIGVGGSTLHYTAYVPRPQTDDFNLYRDFGEGVNWPLGYHDLENYYDELEQFLGVSGPSSYPWGAPRKSAYPLAPLPLNGAAQLMKRGCEKLNIKTSPAANAALSSRYYQEGAGWRNACTNRGFCQAGCNTGAKASMDVTYIPLAIQHGAEIRAESFVTRLELDSSGKISGVVYVKNGVEARQKCKYVFLCAGAIETPRLLLINNLANSSGEVGKNFMAHTGIQVWGKFDEDIRPYKGIPGALISEDTHRPQNANFTGGYLLQSIGVMPVTYASQVARGRGLWGNALIEHMRGYNHTAGINILGDCLPYAGNYLELSAELDGRGLPKPRIHFSFGENERRLTAHAEKLMKEIWTIAGGRDLWAFDRGAHTIGTCRMGTDAGKAVVNSEGQSFDIPNLYISDNSIFPSALSANPALTIMALSLKIADAFLLRSKRNEAGKK